MISYDVLKIVTLAEDPKTGEAAHVFNRANWPEFMFKDPVATECWPDLYRLFPEYQFVIKRRDTDEIVAQVNSLPIVWRDEAENLPNEGWDWVLSRGVEDGRKGRRPNVQCALQIAIGPAYRGTGLSTFALGKMKEIGRNVGLRRLLAPVRPNRKPEFPLIPMARYIKWTTSEGLPFDPWLRVHVRMGARIVRPCPRSMTIRGTVKEWEEWTGCTFPGSGNYVIPGALVPVSISLKRNIGVYLEPNVWVCHDLG